MLLREVLAIIDVQHISGTVDSVEVNGVTYDSRKVQNKHNRYIFVCIEGFKESGTKYIAQALEKGAVAIVSQEKPAMDIKVPFIQVDNARSALAKIAAKIYNYPSDKLKVIGITGTNGKTTITYLLEAILQEHGQHTGVLGTIEYRLGQKVLPAPTTTPQASDLQEFLAEMVKQKFDYVVMEVSSHALELNRTEGCEYDTAVFTNLTRDHLDFHKDFEHYLAAKAKLFTGLGSNQRKKSKTSAVINIDDPAGAKIVQLIPAGVEVFTYGFNEKNAFLKGEEIALFPGKTTFSCLINQKKYQVQLNLTGKHNAYNALAAIGTAISQGIPPETILKGLAKVNSVPGRFELVECGQKFTVVVDYAHTDDALYNVLTAARELHPKRLITVFGAGGDRDRFKRPLMGQVAATLSDYCIVTSDNPRSEDPEKIALDIEIGIKKAGKTNYSIIIDRHEALVKALEMAEPGDLVMIAGKGHENYQIFKDKVIHCDDRETARKILKKR
ncbi:MAG: UDP-N-acetylmuramoyl-L-alanyl-D-glutamate--2,6-diaminopimelate ligase [bacterium]|nr:UDP-N-acetylmuramoyl-L-alanyl-D-glutamate--2,6-diaminopimelate ligase [bacterium]MDD5354566.1 UDP-N-acetylmuramoyl-L-alanyl-D-glutamate--2,6-diaminopimelate ligase [bacterium]MDD5755927.1 UDP-N-acetylmuramoyl-L-alanyl-D-glutamate--2,6-diaminopimelate ligase [bacterium]